MCPKFKQLTPIFHQGVRFADPIITNSLYICTSTTTVGRTTNDEILKIKRKENPVGKVLFPKSPLQGPEVDVDNCISLIFCGGRSTKTEACDYNIES